MPDSDTGHSPWRDRRAGRRASTLGGVFATTPLSSKQLHVVGVPLLRCDGCSTVQPVGNPYIREGSLNILTTSAVYPIANPHTGGEFLSFPPNSAAQATANPLPGGRFHDSAPPPSTRTPHNWGGPLPTTIKSNWLPREGTAVNRLRPQVPGANADQGSHQNPTPVNPPNHQNPGHQLPGGGWGDTALPTQPLQPLLSPHAPIRGFPASFVQAAGTIPPFANPGNTPPTRAQFLHAYQNFAQANPPGIGPETPHPAKGRQTQPHDPPSASATAQPQEQQGHPVGDCGRTRKIIDQPEATALKGKPAARRKHRAPDSHSSGDEAEGRKRRRKKRRKNIRHTSRGPDASDPSSNSDSSTESERSRQKRLIKEAKSQKDWKYSVINKNSVPTIQVDFDVPELKKKIHENPHAYIPAHLPTAWKQLSAEYGLDESKEIKFDSGDRLILSDDKTRKIIERARARDDRPSYPDFEKGMDWYIKVVQEWEDRTFLMNIAGALQSMKDWCKRKRRPEGTTKPGTRRRPTLAPGNTSTLSTPR
ncbi:hypothetical protein BT69DRAFT_245167 [Atractiella rhizophila]|nr:hypothetical protein BT69DRAFT_245167 [Atractiella rhizophila]